MADLTSDLTSAVERHCELFNECVRTGDWAPFTASLTDDALMAFTNMPVGPFHGRDQIAVTLEAVETLDQDTARAHFMWDASGDDGLMLLRWRDGKVSAIEVTFGAHSTST